jgi:hypothetical protein
MAIHIQKLCVGADEIDDLVHWQNHVVAERSRRGLMALPVCNTRSTPKRRDEILDGGSLYWVIKGVILVRQRIVEVLTITEDGASRCELLLDPELIKTSPMRRRPFQGWRYLEPAEAPLDLLSPGEGGAELPAGLREELIALGAW